MKILLYPIAIILVMIWAIGYFALSFGLIIHLLLIMAFVLMLVSVLPDKKKIKNLTSQTQ